MLAFLLVFFSCFPCTLQSHVFHSFEKLNLPSLGSEAFAFDPKGGGPYTTLGDGRLVKYQGPKIGFTDFAITAANRSKKLCDGIVPGNNAELAVQCGRPIGLEINQKTGDLYIIDGFRGLMVVGPQGGIATPLSTMDGAPFGVPDAIGVDPVTGTVFYTDFGTGFFRIRNLTAFLLSGDTSGRLFKYDPKTRQRTVVLTGLSGPNGVAVSKDGTFVVVSEYGAGRIRKVWVKGPKANSSEVLVNLPGSPDNIKRTSSGDFWVPVNIERLLPNQTTFPLAQKFNSHGHILETVNFYAEYNNIFITEVREHLGSLYVASIYANFVGVYREAMC